MNEYEVILREIDIQVKNLEEHLGTGVAKDYAEYQNICGKISGLLSTRRYIQDLNKQMENSDE
jgi:hypothetical protein